MPPDDLCLKSCEPSLGLQREEFLSGSPPRLRVIDLDVTAVVPARLVKSLPKLRRCRRTSSARRSAPDRPAARARERPRRHPADQLEEVPAFHRPCLPCFRLKGCTPQLRQETTALRGFDPAYDGFGSKCEELALSICCPLSPRYSPSKRTFEIGRFVPRAVIRSPRRQARESSGVTSRPRS
jgi:hypothetical protein